MFSNRYIFIYSSVMVIVVAVALALAAQQLKPFQENNIRIEKMQNILISVNLETSPKTAEALYKKYITEEFAVDINGNKIQGIKAFELDLRYELKKPKNERHLPVYVFTKEDGTRFYIMQLYGKGLWGPVWGYIAVRQDMNTVEGTMFGHQGETPGLGAEIDTRPFQKQFTGKKLFDENKQFTSVRILKGGVDPSNVHGVDGISGGTVTSNGVDLMLFDCLTDYSGFLTQKNNK